MDRVLKISLIAAVAACFGTVAMVSASRASARSEGWKKENILIFLAEKHLKAGDLADTVLAADAAIKLNPANPLSRNLKANALNKLGRFEDARTESLRSIGLKGKDNMAAHLNLAVSNLNLRGFGR